MEIKFHHYVLVVLLSTPILVAGLYFLARFNGLFKRYIRNELVRKNLAVWMISICFILAITPTSPEFARNLMAKTVVKYYLIQIAAVTGMVLFVFNVTNAIAELKWVKDASFRKRMGIIMTTIIICTIITGFPVNYFANKGSFNKVEYTLLFNFYTGCITGLIYVTMNYVDLDRQKKLNEKELELSKLQALKTKAELDALHSKINPHFLYNALNSIADLSITDGKKARYMSVALADLFRYSINYNNSNFSTLKDELVMAQTYLDIEKIRFEDRLTYEVSTTDECSHFLVPRFILQPVVENAVKHALKATGKETRISVNAEMEGDKMVMKVCDNGPAFPAEFSPGYGLKSVFDKLELLFPGNFEVKMINEPEKCFEISILKPVKDESAIQSYNRG